MNFVSTARFPGVFLEAPLKYVQYPNSLLFISNITARSSGTALQTRDMSSSQNDIPLITSHHGAFQQQGNTFDKPLLPSVDVSAPRSEDNYQNSPFLKTLGKWSRSHWVSFFTDFVFIGLSILFLGMFSLEVYGLAKHAQN